MLSCSCSDGDGGERGACVRLLDVRNVRSVDLRRHHRRERSREEVSHHVLSARNDLYLEVVLLEIRHPAPHFGSDGVVGAHEPKQ